MTEIAVENVAAVPVTETQPKIVNEPASALSAEEVKAVEDVAKSEEIEAGVPKSPEGPAEATVVLDEVKSSQVPESKTETTTEAAAEAAADLAVATPNKDKEQDKEDNKEDKEEEEEETTVRPKSKRSAKSVFNTPAKVAEEDGEDKDAAAAEEPADEAQETNSPRKTRRTSTKTSPSA
jgi:hypothetical protein